MSEEPTPTQQIMQGAQYESGIQEALRDEVPPNQYTTIDENVIEEVQSDPDLKPTFSLFSHLIRLTDIPPKDKVKFQNNIDLIFGALEIGMSSSDYDAGKWAKMESNRLFLRMAPCDSVKGFKMRLLSRNRKEISFEPPEKQRKGWFK